METEQIKQLATDINNAVEAAQKPLLVKIQTLETERSKLIEAASKWPRCCDQWQDGFGGMHCTECSQKTFSMFFRVQRILGLGKDGKLTK